MTVTTRAVLSYPIQWLKFTVQFNKKVGVAKADDATLKQITLAFKVVNDDRAPWWEPKVRLSDWAEKKIYFERNVDKNNVDVSVSLGRNSPLNFAGAWKRGQYGPLKFCLEICGGHPKSVQFYFFAEEEKSKRVQPSRKRKRSEITELMAEAETCSCSAAVRLRKFQPT